MPSLQPTLKQIDSFTVTGLSVRTQNSDEFNQETAKLPKLWQQFYSSTSTSNTTIFGVYSDYESDANSSYTVTVGIAQNNPNTDLNAVKINAGKYLIFQGKGAMPQTVIETWGRAWDYFTAESPYQRCFMSDFEAYNNNDELSIYIGVK